MRDTRLYLQMEEKMMGTVKKQEKAKLTIDKKRVSISSRRQLSIPKEYYESLNMSDEAIVELHGNRLVIRPAPTEEDSEQSGFIEFIYQDVINEGYQGKKIIDEVNRRKKLIKPSVRSFIDDSIKSSEPLDIEDLFDGNGDE